MKTERKRMIAILLSLMMVFTMIPSMAFAGTVTEENVKNADGSNGVIDAFDYDESEADSVTVTVTLANDGIPVQGNDTDETDIAHLEVTVPYFDLALYGLGGDDATTNYYRYYADDSGSYMPDKGLVERPTVLHLYIYLIERYYLGISEDECGKGNDVSGVMDFSGDKTVRYFNGEEAYSSGGQYAAIYPVGSPQSIYMQNFFGHDENLMYYRNHKFPLWKGGTGSTADFMLLSDGDDIDIAMFSNWEFWFAGSFLSFGKEIYKADPSKELMVGTYSTTTSAVNMGDDASIEPCDGTLSPYVELYDGQWQKVKDINEGITDNGDGTYTVTLPETAGTYYLLAMDANCGSNLAACAPATAKVIVGDASDSGSEPEQGDDEAEDLAKAKTAAKSELETYVDKTKYREEQQTELAAAIEAANIAIDNATDIEGIAEALTAAKTAINTIKTDADLKAEEDQAAAQAAAKALAEAKTAAKKEIAAYKKASDYREAQQAELTAAIDAANTAIDAAATVEAVQKAVADAKAAMGKIKTDAQLTAEEQAAKPKPEPTPTPAPEPAPAPAPIPAEGTVVKDTGNTAKYEVTESEKGSVEVAYTAPVNKKKTTVTIPATVTLADGTTAEVTSIDDKAFKNNKKIKKVTIGKNVEEIGKEAFSGATKLTTVTLGSKVKKIGNKAFYKATALKKVTVPAKTTTIGSSAFYGCKKLTTATIGKNVKTIGGNAFAKCTALKKVTVPAKTTAIGSSAFSGCTKMTTATIGTNVKSIGSKAFYGAKNLKKITIKSTKLTSAKVGKQAFKGVPAKAKVDVPNKKVKAYKKFFYKKGLNKKAKIS